MTFSEKLKKIIRRIFRITITAVLVFLGIILLILVLIQTGPVQNYGRRKLEAYLENKLHTKVRIGNLYVGFPTRIVLKNIYLEDRRKDTLLYGGKISIDISMLRLLRKEIRVNDLSMDEMTMKIKRQMPDSVFNFQFIAEAFGSGQDTAQTKKEGSGFRFVVGTIQLHHIHAVYVDDATGNDIYVNLGNFKTKLKTFDPEHQSYAIPQILLQDISGKIRQYKPVLLLQQIADTISEHNKRSAPVKLQLGEIDFSRISLDYRNEAELIDASIRLGNFHTEADSIDLANLHFKLKQIGLKNTEAVISFGKLTTSKKVNITSARDTVTHGGNWSLDIADFSIDSTRFQYDDNNRLAMKRGIDYNHLRVDHLHVKTSSLHADPSNYRALISGISFDEKSGFVLKNLSAQANYGSKGIEFRNLVIRTGHSEIRNQTSLVYRSWDELKKNTGDMETNLLFDHSRIAVKDILIFVPSLEGPLTGRENSVLNINGKLAGRLKDLRIPYLEVGGVGNTGLSASGSIKGLPDAKKAYYDLTISNLKTSRSDMEKIIPSGTLPENIRIPENISANGKFTGTIKNFFVQLHTKTSNGDAEIKGTLNLENKNYDLTASTRAADLGYILKQDSLMGKITLEASAKGSGFDPKKMNGNYHVKLEEGEFKSYLYHGLLLDARLQNGTATIISSMQDHNLSYQLNAESHFTGKYPSIKLKLQLDTINLLALNWMKDSLRMHMNLAADFSSTNPDALQGQLLFHDIGITQGSYIMHTDSMSLLAQHSDSGQSIHLRSETADIDWTGQFKLTQTPESLKQFLNHYYRLPETKPDSTDPQNWQMQFEFRPSQLVLGILPQLKGTDSLRGNMEFNSVKKDLKLNLHSNRIQYNQQVIHQFNTDLETTEKSLDYRVSVADAGEQGYRLYQTALYGSLAENKLTSTLLLKDKKGNSKYHLTGALTRENKGLRFVFDTDSLLLNYQTWQMPVDNFIHYDSGGLLIRNFKLNRQGESIDINSHGETSESPIGVSFKNFKIKTLTQFAEQDSLLLDGTINGNAEVRELFTKPLFTSDISVDTLSYRTDTLGNLVIQVNNRELNAFLAHISLKGSENDVQIDGKYFSGESKMDMVVKLNQLNLASFRGMAKTQVRNMSGLLKGELHASGNLDQPVLNGELHFDQAVIVPVITGEPLKLTDNRIEFDEEGINFENFILLDSSGNKATVDGNIFTKDFKDYRFDLTFGAENFRIVNAPKAPDKLFYGKLNINANINVTGDLKLPKIDANLRVNKNTDFYVILPSEDPEVVDREGVVIFTRNKPADSAQVKNIFDSLSTTSHFRGMDVSTNIETDSSAKFTLVIDERNGDALSMRGRADLSGTVDNSGKISMTGNYELVNGAYSLTLSILRRKFDIQRGSMVMWTGDPTRANINITASYTVSTAPIDLMQQQISSPNSDEANKYKQRLPFQVKLHMTGELLKPIIKFDIVLPDNYIAQYPDVETKLQQMRTDEAEINKQVFALLLLGRFVAENPFQTASTGEDVGSMAKQSASRILTDQLNQLAGSLVKGVDLSFDMNSNLDYTSGSAQSQTQLNVKVSKSLFNERVRVSVGSDFQLEQTNPGQDATNLAGDVSVDYRLSKDGRYMIRVYRKDQYESVLQAQVIETGLSFILTFDYNAFRELFQNKKEPAVAPVKKEQNKTGSENNAPPK